MLKFVNLAHLIPILDPVNINMYIKLIQIHQFVLKILSKIIILTTKGHNSTFYQNLVIVNINVYIKFDQNLSFSSKVTANT